MVALIAWSAPSYASHVNKSVWFSSLCVPHQFDVQFVQSENCSEVRIVQRCDW